MHTSNISLGRRGESASIYYLKAGGYKILQRNYSNRLGELDIIAHRNSTIYVFEVKTRSGNQHGKPYEAVTPAKAKRLILLGEKYVLQNNLKHSKLSLGVISVLITDGSTKPEIKLYDYFI